MLSANSSGSTMVRSFAIFVSIFVFPIVAFSSGGVDNFDRENVSSNVNGWDSGNARDHDDGSLPNVWAAEMFYRALANFSIREDVGTTGCRTQTAMYLRHLRNNSYWAVKMSDSWSRYPNGLLTGGSYQMGVYNECIDVHKPVQGKYCLTDVKLSAAVNSSLKLQFKDDVETFDHAWNEILAYVFHQDQYRRNLVKIGICIPESCSAENLQVSLQNALDSVFLPHRVQPRVSVEPNMCSTGKDEFPYDTGFYVTITITSLMVAICVLSTLCHLIVITRNTDQEEKSSIPDCVYWFSIIRNVRYLVKYDRNNELNIFNGIKTIAVICSVFGHNFLYYVMSPTSYTTKAESIYTSGPDILLVCMNMVDPYFYIGGFLTYVLVKPQLLKRGTSWIMVPNIIVYKYLRMLPAYGAMILLTMYVVPHINIGPLWASKMGTEAERCKNYWWTNILAISNFYDVNDQCLVVGWYMSCIIQLLIVGITVLYVYVKNPKLGVIILSLLVCVTSFLLFYLTYTARAWGIVRVMMSFLEKTGNSFEFQNIYGQFFLRGIPFYVGMLAGILVEEFKKREFKMSKSVVYISTVIITAICMVVQLHGARFHLRHRPYNLIEQSVYAVLKHYTWSVILFWITICHFTSGYGPIEKLFNNRLTTIFGRLTYAAYLVNVTVILSMTYRHVEVRSFNTDETLDVATVAVMRTHGAGFLLHLFVEAPLNTIIKTIFFGNKNKAIKENLPKSAEGGEPKIENGQHDSRL